MLGFNKACDLWSTLRDLEKITSEKVRYFERKNELSAIEIEEVGEQLNSKFIQSRMFIGYSSISNLERGMIAEKKAESWEFNRLKQKNQKAFPEKHPERYKEYQDLWCFTHHLIQDFFECCELKNFFMGFKSVQVRDFFQNGKKKYINLGFDFPIDKKKKLIEESLLVTEAGVPLYSIAMGTDVKTKIQEIRPVVLYWNKKSGIINSEVLKSIPSSFIKISITGDIENYKDGSIGKQNRVEVNYDPLESKEKYIKRIETILDKRGGKHRKKTVKDSLIETLDFARRCCLLEKGENELTELSIVCIPSTSYSQESPPASSIVVILDTKKILNAIDSKELSTSYVQNIWSLLVYYSKLIAGMFSPIQREARIKKEERKRIQNYSKHELKQVTYAIENRWLQRVDLEGFQRLMEENREQQLYVAPYPDLFKNASRMLRLWFSQDNPYDFFDKNLPETLKDLVQQVFGIVKSTILARKTKNSDIPNMKKKRRLEIKLIVNVFQESFKLSVLDDSKITKLNWNEKISQSTLMGISEYVMAVTNNIIKHGHPEKEVKVSINRILSTNQIQLIFCNNKDDGHYTKKREFILKDFINFRGDCLNYSKNSAKRTGDVINHIVNTKLALAKATYLIQQGEPYSNVLVLSDVIGDKYDKNSNDSN